MPYETSSEEAATKILARLKEDAEKYLGKPVKFAVLTVPIYFNDAQRDAMKEAGKKAGFYSLRIVNETYAAALAFGLDYYDENNIIFLDLGGSSLYVTALLTDAVGFETLAISYDKQLGGRDFDRCLADHFIRLFIERNPAIEVKEDRHAM